MYYLYNHQLILSGAIEILEKDDDRYMIKTYGRELQDKKSGWNTSKFMNSLAVDFDFVEIADKVITKCLDMENFPYEAEIGLTIVEKTLNNE